MAAFWVKPFNSIFKKTKSYQELNQECNRLRAAIFTLQGKPLVLDDGSRFYLENPLEDCIERHIASKHRYYEIGILEDLKGFIPEGAVVVDGGANIGNHSIFFAKYMDVKHIYAFEPLPQTFKKLLRNIKANELDALVSCQQKALAASASKLDILRYSAENTGGTAFIESSSGAFNAVALDAYFPESRLDFLKIDVEGFEIEVLKGAQAVISRFRPLILVESFAGHKAQVHALLQELGYEKLKEYDGENHLYRALRT
ncbi:FkbM family methyltransferase [Polycladidibacter stylochi]|uniref:FkbM family methyltransferase n=1 Tax=Polycladidibacter stylochi TaxID=1807766 RepID=UPI00082A218C|nr:FkbM family methyltransferase [Pseudovibrio stylochi]